jgi:hypothetical protein
MFKYINIKQFELDNTVGKNFLKTISFQKDVLTTM